jgi:predicted glycogen debranching enzyme
VAFASDVPSDVRTSGSGIKLAAPTNCSKMTKLESLRTTAADVERHLPAAEWTRRELISREWLVTNGLGGYGSGTLAGPPTRRYHSLLVAALPAPLGRLALLAQLDERIRLSNRRVAWLSRRDETSPVVISDFRLVGGLPVWRYTFDEVVLEKRLFMPNEQNTIVVTYKLLQAGDPIRLGLRPLIAVRMHEAPVDRTVPQEPVVTAHARCLEVTIGEAVPTIRLAIRDHTATFTVDPASEPLHYELEEQRGYPADGNNWTPGYYKLDLAVNEQVTFIASTERITNIDALPPNDAWATELERRSHLLVSAGSPDPASLTAELVLAADQFVIKPATRTADTARARAAGENARSVIAGYHWFTDWGRDTMISLDGLALSTGRAAEARDTLLTFAQHLHQGLIPNLFPEGNQHGLYHTADATLWFFHAIDRYVTLTRDLDTLRDLLPALDQIVGFHRAGTLFGIRADADGLLTQGDPSLPLTWMDAKVEGWVVTPRRGKPVEINALWFNAVSLLADWRRALGVEDPELDDLARRTKRSFNERFWFDDGGYLYDIVDGEAGDDSACRPNQILSLSLRHPVLDQSRWAAVLDVVSDRLLTPYGLRTLDPLHPDFKAQYFGDLRARDAAYHQGTVWAWLMGPFIDAWLRVHPGGERQALKFFAAFDTHLSDACIGSISEIFDAMPPHAPRGCVAQAWSVAEVLRCLIRLHGS